MRTSRRLALLGLAIGVAVAIGFVPFMLPVKRRRQLQ